MNKIKVVRATKENMSIPLEVYEETQRKVNEVYEKTKDWGRVQFVNNIVQMQYETENLIRENQELKSQKQEWVYLLDKFKTQQKEFIEWLEDKINFWKDKIFENVITENDWTLTLWRNKLGILEESLSKYKEIIGVKDE